MGRGRDIPRRSRRERALLPVLVFTALSVSVMSTLGAPLVPTVADEQGVPIETAQWLLTVTLLTGAVAAPVLGRLGDGPRRRAVITGALLCVVLGGVLGALAPGFGLLIAGRALQGAGMGIMPLTIAVARDFVTVNQARAIATLSVTTSVGAGLGYPVTGLISEWFGYRAAFWFASGVAAVALALVAAVVPRADRAPRRPLDVTGALLLSGALTALLLAVSQGARWGWGSVPVVALFAAAAVLLACWTVQGLACPHPLVELRLLANRAVLTADVAAVLIGIGLYTTMSLINLWAQAPETAGYGFGLSAAGAGFVLLPLSLGSLVAGRITAAVAARVGMGPVLPCGAAVVAADMVFLACFRDHLWQLAAGSVLLGVGVGTTFAAMPGLIVRAVPPHETGSATSLNAVLRSVGGAVGSALIAALLTAYTPAGAAVASGSGYTAAFLVGAAVTLVGGLAAVVLPRLPRSREADREPATGPGDGTGSPAMPASGSTSGSGSGA